MTWEIKICRKIFAFYYEQKGEYKKAYQWYKDYKYLNDSIYKSNFDEKVKFIEIEFENEKIKLENEAMKQNQKANERIAKARTNLFTTYGLVSIAVLAILILLYRNQKVRNELLMKQRELEQQRKERKIEELVQKFSLEKSNLIVESKEAERKRIAQDLHDRMGSLLTVVKIRLANMKDAQEPAQIRASMAEVNSLVDQAVQSVRDISNQLQQGPFEAYGLRKSLEDLCQRFNDAEKFQTNLFASSLNERLPSDLEWDIYQIVSEALNNILKHAEAKKVEVQILKIQERISISIEDDGKGFAMEQKKHESNGLDNMRKRAELHGGEFFVDSRLGRGTMIMVELRIA